MDLRFTPEQLTLTREGAPSTKDNAVVRDVVTLAMADVVGKDKKPFHPDVVLHGGSLHLNLPDESTPLSFLLMLNKRVFPSALEVQPVKASRPSVCPTSSSNGSAAVEATLKSRWARLTSRIRLM